LRVRLAISGNGWRGVVALWVLETRPVGNGKDLQRVNGGGCLRREKPVVISRDVEENLVLCLRAFKLPSSNKSQGQNPPPRP